MATAVDVLNLARTYVARGWTQLVPARDGTGQHCLSWSGAAVQWCASGALNLAARQISPKQPDPYFDALYALHEIVGTRTLARWNDMPGRTREEVLEVFDQAIARLAQDTAHEDGS